MRVTILTQYYPPEHGAPQNRLHDLAKRWTNEGVDVTILTAMPNYPKGEIFLEYKGKFSHEEEIDGVKVIRSAILASKKKSTINQLIVYFSFVFSSMFVGALKLKRSDFLICESPPLFLGFTAILLKFLTKSRLVTNISDLWPESAVQLGMLKPGLILSSLEWFEKQLYKSSVLVSCQTEGIVDGVKMRNPQTEAFLFPNGVDLEMFNPETPDAELRKELGIPEEYFIVGYGGNHGRSQALSQVLQTAELLKDEKIYFAFFGDGPEKNELIGKLKQMDLENVGFFPSQDRQKMSKVQALWDIALVPLKDIELFNGARPSKMFELMAGHIPFIFCGRGEGADLAVESGCAVKVKPENPQELADAVNKMASLSKDELEKMGRKGRAFVEEKFDRKKLAVIFLEKLKNILGETK